jgi:hypothetical protein
VAGLKPFLTLGMMKIVFYHCATGFGGWSQTLNLGVIKSWTQTFNLGVMTRVFYHWSTFAGNTFWINVFAIFFI